MNQQDKNERENSPKLQETWVDKLKVHAYGLFFLVALLLFGAIIVRPLFYLCFQGIRFIMYSILTFFDLIYHDGANFADINPIHQLLEIPYSDFIMVG